MQTENLIAASIFCGSHNIEVGFISSLQQYGLIEVTTIDDNFFIRDEDLPKLEQFTRFYYEMDINLEGIEVIHHLLGQLHNQKAEITILRNKLLALGCEI